MDWKVFQTDVLDSLRQYERYFDFFERTGSLTDKSRPDSVARISRERKKIWIFDAKNKSSISDEDEARMEKYVHQIRRKPMEIGLENSELSDHEIQTVFITREKADSNHRVVKFDQLHSYLRKELIYPETNLAVRNIAQMADKKMLSHSQARILYRSLDKFRERMDEAEELMKNVEQNFTSLKLDKPPFEGEPNVDFILEHPDRPKIYIDVPYRDQEMNRKIEDGVYVVLGGKGDYGCGFSQFEEELMKKQGLLSWKKVAELFTPKIPSKTRYDSSTVVIEDDIDLGFKLVIRSEKDTSFKVEAKMPSQCLEQIRNQALNSRKDFGKFENRFRHSFSVSKGLEIDYGTKESWPSYVDTVESIYQSGINPLLSKKVSQS